LRAAPVGIGFPEVEMHANMIASILDNNFKQQPDFGVGFDLLQTLLLGIALALVLPMLTPAMAIAFAACAAAAVGAFNFWAYQSLKLVLPLATGLLLIFGLLIVNLAWGYLFESRKRRAVVDLFGQYVAPEMVREMAADPHSYGMEAQSRHLTALFADVRDFTAIAQRMEPNALREYIRLYLTAMSEDIHGSRGTLDKYIGGAVMAFWGAPVPFPDHASRAVATALAMQKTARQLNEEFLERDWPELHIGIGLNTGMMQVGDMGSKIRRAYTVVGDAVNLCARLEGLANAYGVGIVVGEATCLAAPEFAYREIDRMRVEGSNDPVPIFEPVAPESELDAEMISAIYQWHDALGLLRSRQWDEAERSVRELQGQNPDDGLYAFYLQRIARFRENPPAADWDGVAGLDGK
jgi:adenylate cyclase